MDVCDCELSTSKEEQCMIEMVGIEEEEKCNFENNGNEVVYAQSQEGYLPADNVSRMHNDGTQCTDEQKNILCLGSKLNNIFFIKPYA